MGGREPEERLERVTLLYECEACTPPEPNGRQEGGTKWRQTTCLSVGSYSYHRSYPATKLLDVRLANRLTPSYPRLTLALRRGLTLIGHRSIIPLST